MTGRGHKGAPRTEAHHPGGDRRVFPPLGGTAITLGAHGGPEAQNSTAGITLGTHGSPEAQNTRVRAPALISPLLEGHQGNAKGPPALGHMGVPG